VIITALVATYLKDDTIMELSDTQLQVIHELQDVQLVYTAATPNYSKMGNESGRKKPENRRMFNT
jgi:hypothetical protein